MRAIVKIGVPSISNQYVEDSDDLYIWDWENNHFDEINAKIGTYVFTYAHACIYKIVKIK
jgi:hypothetical protein